MKRSKAFNFALISAFILFVSCRSGEIRPVEIENSDMCSFCKMAISEKKFAAEIITENDEVFKFDDIGCMFDYKNREGEKLKIAAVFVVDFDTKNWIKPDEAFFVRSENIKSPMSGGIIAFAESTKARVEAGRLQTRVLTFAELSSK